MEEKLSDGMKAGGIFPKTEEGRRLCDEYSAYIRKIKASGEFEAIREIWFGDDETKKIPPPINKLPGPNGTFRMAADTAAVPFVFIKDGQIAGVDVEYVFRFCEASGYALEIMVMDFGAILPAIVSDRCDFAAGGIAFTAERAESVYFSEPTYEGGSVIAVLADTEAAGGGFFQSVWKSFEKTFIHEARWKLFLRGILNTVLITLLSLAAGTLLGFALFLLCRRGGRLVGRITGLLFWLIRGMPVVVLLMVLYYIIFSGSSLSGLAVAVVAFSLIFGAAMFGMLWSGTAAVDGGQAEAAYALGYKDGRAFFRFILPQAALHFMPEYKAQVVALIKGTSVVGYIAVQDLTRIGDIIRSRTYEAFFPLVAVTVIYFILAALLTRIVAFLMKRIDPRRRGPEKILKGVNVHD